MTLVHETALRAAQGAARQAVRGYVGYEEWPASRLVRREVARRGVALILAFGEPLGVRDSIQGRVCPLRAFVAVIRATSRLSASAWIDCRRSAGLLGEVAVYTPLAYQEPGRRRRCQLASRRVCFASACSIGSPLALSDGGGLAQVSWLRSVAGAGGRRGSTSDGRDRWSRVTAASGAAGRRQAYARSAFSGVVCSAGEVTLADVAIECADGEPDHHPGVIIPISSRDSRPR